MKDYFDYAIQLDFENDTVSINFLNEQSIVHLPIQMLTFYFIIFIYSIIYFVYGYRFTYVLCQRILFKEIICKYLYANIFNQSLQT